MEVLRVNSTVLRPFIVLCCTAASCVCLLQIVIDVSKHAVLGKFNDIRPGIYREYMRDLCSDSLDKHSHNIHKLVSLKQLQLLHLIQGGGRPDC